ncbi:MAG: CAP domain-containing protein [Rivularia sp. ALOHA_DT_140]|nr:CAP domain-containing protein [Rivularia sp. ALOHA_DT_140]
MTNPSAKEQYMLELINRMRMNPDAEYDLLVNSTNEDIQTGLSIVDLDVLKSQWNQLKPVQPLAWSNQLHLSAVNHTQLMIDNNAQKHNFPGEPSISERIANTGYEATTQTENIYAFGSSVLESHAAFAIDWGDDDNNLDNGKGTGIQNPPAHRNAIMSNEYREVGIGILREDTSGTKVNKLFTTQHFANSKELSETNTSWLLGTVFRDVDNDDFYSVGEGLEDITVQIRGISDSSFTTSIQTLSAGGYQTLLSSGVYQVDFIRDNNTLKSETVTIGSNAIL